MMVGEHSIAPKADHFLSETKPGWKIVDIKLKDKTSHYLWGRQSGQLADSPRGRILVTGPTGTNVNDVAVALLGGNAI